MSSDTTGRRSRLARTIGLFREKTRTQGFFRTLGRAVYHLGQVVVRGRKARHSWQLLTDRVPELQLVNVEVTTFCNLGCVGCQRTIHAEAGQWNNRHLSKDSFRRLVEELPTVHEFIPQGIGEPALHPHLPELILIAHKSGKFNEITMTSHGMARDVDYFLRLFECGLTKLYLSVDALDESLVERLRPGTKLDVLKSRLAELARRRPGQVSARVTLGLANIDHLPDMLAQLDRLGSPLEVAIHPYDDLGDAEGCLSLEERLAFSKESSSWGYRYSNLTLNIQGFTPATEMCRSPWHAPSVRVDGELTPCCRIMYHHSFSFGNVFEASFDRVWHAPQTEQWRRQFRESMPEVCQGCPSYAPRVT